MANISDLNNKFEAKLKQKNWQLDNAAGIDRLKDAVILGDEAKKNSCFGAVAAAIAIGAVIVKLVLS